MYLRDARHGGDGEAPAWEVGRGRGAVVVVLRVVVVVAVAPVVVVEVKLGRCQEVDEIEGDFVPEHGTLVVVPSEGGGGGGRGWVRRRDVPEGAELVADDFDDAPCGEWWEERQDAGNLAGNRVLLEEGGVLDFEELVVDDHGAILTGEGA